MGSSDHGQNDHLAESLIQLLISHGKSIAAAESLTGGLVTAALTSVPGASACVRGGVVTYATDLKGALLGVDPNLLAEVGPVDDRVAAQMARGVARMCGSEIGLATTGVAGPSDQNGIAVGTVFVGYWSALNPDGIVQRLQLAGDRAQIRSRSVRAVLDLALSQLPG